MKKWLLGLTMALVFTGCGAKSDGGEVPKTEVDEIVLNNGETTDSSESSDIPERDPVPYRYESTRVRFEIQSMNPDASQGYEMKLLFENKIEETELHFALEEFSVQRYRSDTYTDYIAQQSLGSESGTITVDPLSTKEVTVYLNREALEEIGITTVDEIAFYLRAWNWDYNNHADVAYEEVKVYPTGLDEDSIVVPELQETEGMKTVLENDRIRMVLLGFEVNEAGKLQAKYFVENKGDTFVSIEMIGGNRKLNGESYDSPWLYGFYLNGNSRCYVDIGLYHEEVSQLADVVSPEQVSSFEATVMLNYTDEAQNRHEEELRLIY